MGNQNSQQQSQQRPPLHPNSRRNPNSSNIAKRPRRNANQPRQAQAPSMPSSPPPTPQAPQEIPSSISAINPYEFFQISESSSLEDLKNAYRKIVLKYHPDRGGDPQIFALIQHYYKELEEDIRRRNGKIYERPVVPQTYDDTMNRGQRNIHLDSDPKKFDVERFNQVFSEVQSGIQQEIGDPTARGYGDYMDNTQRRSADDPVTLGGEKFRNFEQEANDADANKDVMVYREPEILYSGQGLSFIELGQTQINDFSGYDSRGNVRFMDYKRAMSNPQEIRAAPRPEYRNVDEYKRARENIVPLTEEEKQQQIYKKQQEQQQEEERQRKLTENDHIIQRHFQNVNHRFIR